MADLKEFPVYKKRDGQGYKRNGYIYTDTFENAKKEFAEKCYNDLLNGVHGDNFIELKEGEDGFEVPGVYTEGQLFMPKKHAEEGIEIFSEDVYTWELRDI